MNFNIFWQSLQFFHVFWHLLSLFKLFESQVPENLKSGWMISYWKFFWSHRIGFNFWISQILAIFLTKFASFWKFSSYFQFFQLQGQGNLLWGLLIGHFIVSFNNGRVFHILVSQILAFFLIKSAIFSRYPKVFVSFWYSSTLKCEKSYSTFW